jgi:hypothetical protein
MMAMSRDGHERRAAAITGHEDGVRIGAADEKMAFTSENHAAETEGAMI